MIAVPARGTTRTSSTSAGESLALRSKIWGIVLDYGLPQHPVAKGRSHAGAIADARLVWTLDEHFAIEAGILARLPFTLDFAEEAGALPIVALVVRPLGDDPASVVTRFGSLATRHGYHPAILDEERYSYGRNYADTYRASLNPGVERNLGRDLFLPAEHGAQIIVDHAALHAEAFLDWQLLETQEHREKLAAGALASLRSLWGELAAEMRLLHYGGERFTQIDPVRAAGLDPVRQPTAYALRARLRSPFPRAEAAPDEEPDAVAIDLLGAWIAGRVAGTTHHGVEAGADVTVFGVAYAGWRWWLPIDRDYGLISEDGDPVYSGRRSHRARVGFEARVGPADLSGKLDLVFAEGGGDVQYETVTMVAFSFDPVLWRAR